MYIINIFVISACILYTNGLDIKLKYCRFRCSNACETPEDKSNPVGTSKPPTAYYWRDFYGTIPTDAFPLGPSTQFPQTYIGMVYDPSRNGSFATTIYDGLDYVYTAFNNETKKIDKPIQILCTTSPGQLAWLEVTKENARTLLETYQFVRAAFHVELSGNRHVAMHHFIVKTNKCKVTYAGVVMKLTDKLQYALIDGSYDTTDQFLWLMYKKDEPANNPETSGPSPSKSFFSHRYEYKIRPNSIVPQFYKQLTIGSCSVTCTNEDQSSKKKIKNDPKLSTSMVYYWKPYPVIDKEEAFTAGEDQFGKTLYVGQAFITSNVFDVGGSNLKTAYIYQPSSVVSEGLAFSVMSTNYPDQFIWKNTTAQDFASQDRNKMIPGGMYPNGTITFVCREVDSANSNMYSGSARVWTEGTYCNTEWGPVENYQLLMYDKK